MGVMSDTTTSVLDADRGDELAQRLFLAGVAAFELLTVELGVRLGLYETLRRREALTAAELAEAAGIGERYAREWLEQQAVASLLDLDDVTRPANERRYRLPTGHDEVLLDPESLRFVAPIAGFLVSFNSVVDDLVDAFRTGRGLPYRRYGAAMRDSQGAFNRPLFTHVLTADWLPNAVPHLHRRLASDRPSRVADLGCGVGWSSIALASAYPSARVDGIDSDAVSIDHANKLAAEAGVSDRLVFRIDDAANALPDREYDAVFIFEALHDMSQPVAALSAARQMLADGGVCVVMDEKVADEFTAPGDEVERFMFAASVLHCLPVGLAEQPSAGTGTMLRRSTMVRYANEAGFRSVTDLEVEHDFFRLYRLDA
jgi:2-polyprenyl-3-methyl-5-hydroxy-6-metoxy-1,4-benzoquinol methylase